MSTQVLAVKKEELSPTMDEWNRDRIELIKRTFCKGATDDELHLFIATCKKLGLSPEARQIFAVKRWDSKEQKEVMSIQTSIDGHRLVAERTGEYEGQTEPQWCGDDGQWKDCWLSSAFPKASRVGVFKKGFKTPLFATAHWDEFIQTNKQGVLAPMWRKMPRLMIAKCAESLALRKAFPNELSGVYTSDEMGQSQSHATLEATELPQHTTIMPVQEKPAIEATKPSEPMIYTHSSESSKGLQKVIKNHFGKDFENSLLDYASHALNGKEYIKENIAIAIGIAEDQVNDIIQEQEGNSDEIPF